jgi:hypothetical protein
VRVVDEGPGLSDPEKHSRGFWQTLPGVLTAIATVLTAVTGLLIAFGQLGLFDREDGNTAPNGQSSTAISTPGDTAENADPVSGTWSGEATQGSGGSFEVRLEIKEGCEIAERCGSISVSHVPCFGDLSFYEVSRGRYEFSVDNFSGDSGTSCTPGAGEYLTPQEDGTLLYTTGYDPNIRGTLQKSPG